MPHRCGVRESVAQWQVPLLQRFAGSVREHEARGPARTAAAQADVVTRDVPVGLLVLPVPSVVEPCALYVCVPLLLLPAFGAAVFVTSVEPSE